MLIYRGRGNGRVAAWRSVLLCALKLFVPRDLVCLCLIPLSTFDCVNVDVLPLSGSVIGFFVMTFSKGTTDKVHRTCCFSTVYR